MLNESAPPPGIRRVAIVGSGLAGLTAARLLMARNCSVTLFEKSRGPGGRLAAKRVSDGSPDDGSVDIGAQYFTVRTPAFDQFLIRHAGQDCFAAWRGQFGFQTESGGWEPFPEETRYVGVPRMTALTRSLASGLDVQAETRIAHLDRSASGWTLQDTHGKSHGFYDAVIITAPPAQARDLLRDSNMPVFEGQLDEAVCHVQPCWAAAIHFHAPLKQAFDGMRCRDDVLYWIGNNSSKPGRENQDQWWVLHANPVWSGDHRDSSAGKVVDDMVTAFQRVTGCQSLPDQCIYHRWLYAKSSSTDLPGFRWSDEHRIGLAGDWLSGGRVEGAFESASALVEHLISD